MMDTLEWKLKLPTPGDYYTIQNQCLCLRDEEKKRRGIRDDIKAIIMSRKEYDMYEAIAPVFLEIKIYEMEARK